jgi:hypothetical protein
MRRIRIALAPVLMCLVVGACTKEITLQQYPPFYSDELRTLAIRPPANDSDRRRASELLTDKLASSFRANGTYEVVPWREVAERIGDRAEEMTDEELARALEGIDGPDAVLTGVVEHYRTRRNVYYTRPSGYVGGGYGGYGGYGRYYGYPHYSLGYRYPLDPVRRTFYEAHVAAEGTLYAAGGQVLHRSPLLEVYRDSDDGRGASGDRLLSETAEVLAGRFVAEFAIAPVRVEVKPDEALYTARRVGARLKKTDDFDGDESEMILRIKLPAQANRNKLEVRVVPAGSPGTTVASRKLRYSVSRSPAEVALSPAEIHDSHGAGEYLVQLVGKAGVLLEQDVEIAAAGSGG